MAPVSFQPWSLDKPASTDLKDVLARVAIERGHFRDISEASLQEEIATDGALSPSGSSSEDEQDDDEEERPAQEGRPATREQLQKAKVNMIQQASIAHNEVMMALDFVSLLESERSTNAAHTMSQALKTAVPPKTLGTDVWQSVPVNQAKEAQDATLAHNVKMRSLQRSADDILSAAKRLEDNVRKETHFWDQMLSISEKGWSVSRLPRSQKLGVRYGFSESSREFSGRSVAALNSNADGSIALEHGFGAKPQGLRVIVHRNGQATGRSYLPTTAAEAEVTLEARIRHSRDSIFDEELFREVTRESRTMSSFGVKMKGNSVTFPAASTKEGESNEIQLDVVPLSEETGAQLNTANSDDTLAQAIALSARLLLSQAHRERVKKRSEVPVPMSDQKEDRRLIPILHSVMSIFVHRAAVEALNGYIDTISKLLSRAAVNVQTTRAQLQLPNSNQIENAEQLALALETMFVSEAQLQVNLPNHTATQTVSYRVESTLAQQFGPKYILLPAGKRPVNFDERDALAETSDAAIAASLARLLHSTAGDGWSCDTEDALLSRLDAGDDGRSQAWIALDYKKQSLTLASMEKKTTWTLDGEGAGKRLLDVWKGMA